MMNQTAQVKQDQELTRRSVARISLFMMSILGIGVLAGLALIIHNGTLQKALKEGILFIWASYLIFLALAYWLNRRGQSLHAIRAILGGLAVVLILVSLLYTGYGLIGGAGLFLFTLIVVTQTRLPSRQASETIIASAVVSLALLLLDYYGPAGRQAESESFQELVGGLLGIVVIVFAIASRDRWSDFHLSTKLIVSFVAISAISVVAVSLGTVMTLQYSLSSQVSMNLKSLATNKGQIVGNRLDRELNLLQVLAANTTVQVAASSSNTNYYSTDTPESIRTRLLQADARWKSASADDSLVRSVLNHPAASALNQFLSDSSGYAYLQLLDEHGATVASSMRLSGYYQGDQPWWQAAYNSGHGDLYIGEPELIPEVNEYGIVMAVPISAGSPSQVIGVLKTVFRTQSLGGEVAPSLAGEVGEARILFPEGFILSNQGGTRQGAGQELYTLRTLIANPGYVQMSLDQQNRLVSAAPVVSRQTAAKSPVAKLGWAVVTSQTPESAFQPINSATRASLIAGVLALLVSSLLALLVTRFLASPITRLTQVAEQVTAGDLNARAAIESGDEIGELATTFNRMTAQLGQTLETLEQRVADRTADLAQATNQLRERARELETSADLSRASASTLQVQELVPQVVQLLGDRFVASHVGLYLLDERGEQAVLAGAFSAEGQPRLEPGERVQKGSNEIVGYVLGKGEPYLSHDVTREPTLSKTRLSTTRSEFAVPLWSAGQVIGALDVHSDHPNRFTEAEVKALTGLSAQIAIAIQNARSFERQTTLAAENRQLFERSQHTADELNALNRRLTGEAWAGFFGQKGEFVLQDKSPDYAHMTDPSALAEAASKADLVATRADGFSSLAVPIVVRGEVIGSLALEDVDARGEWKADEVAIVKDVAEHLALALENARLFEQTQMALAETRRAAERESELARINDRLHARTDVQSILQTAAEELLRTTGRSRAVVWLPGSDGESNGKRPLRSPEPRSN